ncbi:hypothetical protein STRAU_7522 [Streptomyces aurantiacus JA 4570]|uniref:Uncharacterized protein n=1 Tax=Streptomyces aurantiacus JA 4570 TaxID=1286094 RepID=S3Z6Q9_9ACTN|nr:hypothetical protein STRAU_7522 [Streptomyces aurantiacus JA 4570]
MHAALPTVRGGRDVRAGGARAPGRPGDVQASTVVTRE